MASEDEDTLEALVSQYPPDPNMPPPPDSGQGWGAPPPGAPPDPYGPPPGAPPDPYGQQPPGAPGWGPQSGASWQGQGTPPPMAPAKKGTNPAIPILIVVALVAVGVGAYFLLSGSDDGGDPEAVVEDYINADGCADALELVSASSLEAAFGSREEAVSQCETAVQQGAEDLGPLSAEAELVSAEVTSESDSAATVAAEIRLGDGEPTTTDIDLVKEDGEWRVDFGSFAAGGGGGGGGGDTTVPTPETTSPSTETTETTDSGGSGGGGGGGGGGTGEAAPIPYDDPTGTPEDFANAEGCASGSMAACDDLYTYTNFGSELEAYGRSCGGRDTNPTRPANQCAADFG